MDEISSRFVNEKDFETSFVIWDEETARFYVVDYTAALSARRKQAEPQLTSKPTEPASTNPLKSKLAKLSIARTAHKSLKAAKNRASARTSLGEPTAIEPGAILFMPHGGVWESDVYVSYVLALKARQNVKLALILYDMCPVLTQQFCSSGIRRIFDKCMRRLLPEVDLILPISENTAKDGDKWLKSIDRHRKGEMSIFRLGDEINKKDDIKPSQTIPKEFILCVGTVEARKNHTGLYYAYKLATERGIVLPPIVVVGRRGWLAEDIYEIITNDPDTEDAFIFLHTASDEELTWLYEHALVSVYPSFYEGWGLPVAESLLRGLPCVASNSSSIPEIAGDLVDYFSPYSPDEMLQQITKLTSDKQALADKKQRVLKEYRATTWEKSFEQVCHQLKLL